MRPISKKNKNCQRCDAELKVKANSNIYFCKKCADVIKTELLKSQDMTKQVKVMTAVCTCCPVHGRGF